MSSPQSGEEADHYENISGTSFVASLASGLGAFGAQVAVFYFLKFYFPRIYRPRTYLVPERERTPAPPEGLFSWIIPVFTTPNSEFIRKCGLDAYFFLRYLRLLIKIFFPAALIILPILLPINGTGGNSKHPEITHVEGLSSLAWANIAPYNVNRFWAHLVLAVIFIAYVCYTFFGELRGYARLRQAYLTSPQHRLRASATTVLVTSIPNKWLSPEALDSLFDVFPGGVRNIWVNRDFQELSDKVDLRDNLAKKLESAETNLIKNAKQRQRELQEKADKKAGMKLSKKEKDAEVANMDGSAEVMAMGNGNSAGNPHQVHTLRQFFHSGTLDDIESESSRKSSPERKDALQKLGLGAVEAVGEGLGNVVSTGVSKIGRVIPGWRGGSKEENNLSKTDTKDRPTSADADRQLDGSNEAKSGAPFHSAGSSEDKQILSGRQTSVTRSSTLRSDGVGGKFSMDKTRHLREHSKSDKPAKITIGRPSTEDDMDHLDLATQSNWKFWKKNLPIPSPTPQLKEQEHDPLTSAGAAMANSTPQLDGAEQAKDDVGDIVDGKKPDSSHDSQGPKAKAMKKTIYKAAYDEQAAAAESDDGEWRKYLESKDRESTRLPLFGQTWLPFMPAWTGIGKKVDVIYYCRKEVARLNLEIEADQKHPENFPLMNSAFIQFNHQVAAHMACQSVAHHLPQQMTPRIVEISPDDVLWDNMSMKWWERYIRTAAIALLIAGMIVLWAVPVAFSGSLSQLTALADKNGFHWIHKIPRSGLSLLQGVLPPIILAVLFVLVPILLRLFHTLQGLHTGNEVQLSVQKSYFAFLFVELFLVVTVSSSIVTVLQQISRDVTSTPKILAQNIPKAANYFFNYMILQALSVSAGALAQVASLIGWFILRPILDSTPRQKWSRQLTLPQIQWGKFFPVYTNLAVIGIIYSIIAPLVMVFNVITFSLFWVVYRYNTLYVNKFRFDTGGLLFPIAVNELFVGLYVLEVALIGLFFLVRNDQQEVAAKSQAIIMIVVLILTLLYQYLLNDAFSPLFRYLPITLEDEAVLKDEEFARAQSSYRARQNIDEQRWGDSGDTSNDGRNDEEHEMQDFGASTDSFRNPRDGTLTPGSWANRSRSRARSRSRSPKSRSHEQRLGRHKNESSDKKFVPDLHELHQAGHSKVLEVLHPRQAKLAKENPDAFKDIEAQRAREEHDRLFGNTSDEIEDLTPDERDALIERAFRHRALRARRPVIWIPRDDLGVSDDEIRRTHAMTDFVWISNEGTGLDSKGRCIFGKPPPDFSDLDLIDL